MSKVLNEIQLRHLRIKNRLVRSAVHSFLGSTDGLMTAAEYEMYETLAKGGVGLIITGHCSVSLLGMANDNQTGIYEDAFIPQFRKLRELVQPFGVKIVAQINHAGPRAIQNDDPAGPSASELKKGKYCRALTLEEIAAIRAQFIDAACRAQQAGLDGVQIHAAHSYLLSQFMDETFNHRTDDYGGTPENRFRLTHEILMGIKARCGADFPVFIKLNSDTATNDAQYERDLIDMLETFAQSGAEAIELSGYDFLSQPKTAATYYLERAARCRAAVDLPLALVGGVRSLADMESVMDAGIDMISLGRPLICEPDLIKRLLGGQERSQCLCCNRCFVLPKIKPGMRCVRRRKLGLK